MEMNNRYGIPMGGRIQLDPSINVDTLKVSPACKVIARALQKYGAYNGDYAGATVLYCDNSPTALKRWKSVLGKEDLLGVFTPSFIRDHFRVIKLGKLLPGQNLEGAQYGFIDFSFPGAGSVNIDWLKNRIDVYVSDSSDLKSVVPVFKTVKRNAVVTLGNAIQESGRFLVDLTSPVHYTITIPGGGSGEWTVTAIKK